MLFVLFFFLLYLVPVIPLARRKAWEIENNPKVLYTIPERKRNKSRDSSHYIYINKNIIDLEDDGNFPCQNCGAERQFHRGGLYSTIGGSWAINHDSGSEHFISCKDYQKWDRVKDYWPAQDVLAPMVGPNKSIPLALGISLLYPLSLSKAGYKKIEPNWNGFAKAPTQIAQPSYEALQIEIDRLERELQIGPHSKDDNA